MFFKKLKKCKYQSLSTDCWHDLLQEKDVPCGKWPYFCWHPWPGLPLWTLEGKAETSLLEQLSHTLRAAHSVRYAKKISHDRGGIKENLFRWKNSNKRWGGSRPIWSFHIRKKWDFCFLKGAGSHLFQQGFILENSHPMQGVIIRNGEFFAKRGDGGLPIPKFPSQTKLGHSNCWKGLERGGSLNFGFDNNKKTVFYTSPSSSCNLFIESHSFLIHFTSGASGKLA